MTSTFENALGTRTRASCKVGQPGIGTKGDTNMLQSFMTLGKEKPVVLFIHSVVLYIHVQLLHLVSGSVSAQQNN